MAQPTSESWNPQWKERTNCLQSGPLTPHVHIPIFIHISYTHTTIKYKVGVKRSLSDQEHLLFLYKTWLLLPAPTQQLTTIYNLSSGAPTPSSGSRGHQTCKGYNKCTCRPNIHSHKKLQLFIYFYFVLFIHFGFSKTGLLYVALAVV